MSGPPEFSDDIKLPEDSDIPGLKEATPLSSANNVVDILLVTVVDCEFKACLFYLQNPSVYKSDGRRIVYIGKMGEGNEEKKLKVALIKCDMGSAGAATAVNYAVTTLKPKAVFCVGFCGGMNAEKAKLGDVVVSGTLISYELAKITKDGVHRRGPSVRLDTFLNDLMKYVSYGWKAPVKNKGEAGKVVNGAMLSGDKLVNAREEKEKLLKEYSHAIAIEMEGAGIYTAARELKTEWVVVKGISDYADGTKDETKAWKTFGSVMAASLVAHILSNPLIFEDWPHYEGASAVPVAQKRPFTRSSSSSSQGRDNGKPAETSGVAPKKTRTEPSSSSASNRDDNVKDGQVSDPDLERLASLLADKWTNLGRRLLNKMENCESLLRGILRNNQDFPNLSAKALEMLMQWKESEGDAATYRALYDALCHDLVQCRLWAQKICCE